MSVEAEFELIKLDMSLLNDVWTNDLPMQEWNKIAREMLLLHAKKSALKLSQYLHHELYAHLWLDLTQVIIDDLMQDFSDVGLTTRCAADLEEVGYAYTIHNGPHQGYFMLTPSGIRFLEDLDAKFYNEKQYIDLRSINQF
jgi:hypothetical protein